MQTRTPSDSAICGLCAAFFLTASIRWASYLLNVPFLWQRHDVFAEPFWWTQAAAGLVFVLVSAFVGVHLLNLRPQSVLHGLILGWLCLVFNVVTSAQLIYSFTHGHTVQRPEQWVIYLAGSVVSVLFPAVVVWLLHVVRSRERAGVNPLPASLQTA